MKLTPRVRNRIGRDFKAAERDRALYVMESVDIGEDGSDGSERLQAAILLLANGNLDRLLDAASLTETDWRDTLMEADLAHEDWRQKVDAYFGP